MKRQDDAGDAIVPGNCQEQLETLSIPEKTELLPDGIGHPTVPGCFFRVKDNRPLLLRKAICRLEFPQALSCSRRMPAASAAFRWCSTS